MTEPGPGATGRAADVAAVTAEFGAALHEAGVPVDPGRCERFARAVTLMRPRSVRELHACGLATLVSGPDQIEIYDRVFAAAFGERLEVAVPASTGDPAGEPDPRTDGEPPPGAPPTPQLAQLAADGRPGRRTGTGRSPTVPCRGGRCRPRPSGWPAGTSPTCPRRSSASWKP